MHVSAIFIPSRAPFWHSSSPACIVFWRDEVEPEYQCLKPNERDMPPKRAKRVQLGNYGHDIEPYQVSDLIS